MNNAVHLTHLCLAIAALVVFWQFAWRNFAIDVLRQALFLERDALFDLAEKKESGLTFDSRAYQELRLSINKKIRYAHRISFGHICLTAIFLKLSGVDWEGIKSPTEKVILELQDNGLKSKLFELHMRSGMKFIRFVAMTSLLFWVMSFVSLGAAIAAMCFKGSFALTKAIAALKDREIKSSEKVMSLREEADCADAAFA